MADSRLSSRDCHVAIGLFAPERYGIEKHLGYDIKILGDFYRSISIIKNRIGIPNLKLPVLFNGQTNSFSELPDLGTPQLNTIYEVIKNYRNIS